MNDREPVTFGSVTGAKHLMRYLLRIRVMFSQGLDLVSGTLD